MKPCIYVIAGNRSEFDEWCRSNMVSSHSPLIRYVGEGQGDMLRGLRNPNIIPYGSYHERRDFIELEELIRTLNRPIGPQIIYVEVEPPKRVMILNELRDRIVNWQQN
jgi:hypothetical protein